MYPSILILPIPIAGFYLYKRWKGPHETLKFSASLSRRLLSVSQKYLPHAQSVTPERIHPELALLHHLTPHKLFTCLETSCAFQQWLAVHGESGRVVIGKRVENGHLLMHAWVETEHAVFFKESEFETVEWIL